MNAVSIPDFLKSTEKLRGITAHSLRAWINENEEQLRKDMIVVIMVKQSRKTYRILNSAELEKRFFGL